MDAKTINAKLAVEAIIADLSNRRDLDSVWESIDEDVQDEIRDLWTQIVWQHM